MTRRARLLFALLCAACVAGAILAFRSLAARSLAFTFAGQRCEMLAPEALALLCALPVILFAATQSLADLPRPQHVLSVVMRVLLLAVLTLALCRIVTVRDSPRVSVTVAVDVSDSIDDRALAAARTLAASIFDQRGDNDFQLVTFAARPRRVDLPETAHAALPIARHTATPDDATPLAATDLQAAVQVAYGLSSSDASRRVLLISDGNETHGDLVHEAERAARLGVVLDYALLAREPPREIAARALTLPEPIELGKTFRVRATLFSTTAARARVKLFQDDVQNGLDGSREVDLHAGDNALEFSSVARLPGKVSYRLEVTPLDADRFAANNVITAAATVAGKPRVLLVDPEPQHLAPLASALGQSELDSDVRSPTAMPRTVAELARYDFFILSDTPYEALSPDVLNEIERYVRDTGGGFMLAGGDGSFGLGGYQNTRMEQLMPVRMAAERKNEEHSLALALVIDCSGSMAGQKLELAKEAARATAEVLGDSDSIEVIGFSGQPERKVRLQSARNRVGIAQNIARLAAQGGTQIFPALDAAYQDLSAIRARIKHVILLTDGQTQESGIPELVQSMRADAITVSTVGLGADVNKSLLQQAASLGGGRTYLTNDPENVPRIFVHETTSMKRDSAVEELSGVVLREPADFLKGLDLAHAPLLRGYVATQPKPAPAQVILESERGEPILARWHVGLGWALAWTPDVKARWASDWLRWSQFPRFFSQLVREHMRATHDDSLPMQVTVHDGVAHLSVDALGHDDRFLDGLTSEARIAGANGSSPATALRQVGPGSYEADLVLPGFGAFAIEVVHRRGESVVARSRAPAQNAYPSEYARVLPNEALLQRAASLTGGHANPSASTIWKPGRNRPQTHEETWPGFVAAALGLFLLDLLVRRVSIFDKKSG